MYHGQKTSLLREKRLLSSKLHMIYLKLFAMSVTLFFLWAFRFRYSWVGKTSDIKSWEELLHWCNTVLFNEPYRRTGNDRVHIWPRTSIQLPNSNSSMDLYFGWDALTPSNFYNRIGQSAWSIKGEKDWVNFKMSQKYHSCNAGFELL